MIIQVCEGQSNQTRDAYHVIFEQVFCELINFDIHFYNFRIFLLNSVHIFKNYLNYCVYTTIFIH